MKKIDDRRETIDNRQKTIDDRQKTIDNRQKTIDDRRKGLSSIDYSLSTNNICRLLTCGSVDDGKSTLIGRLLYDSKALFEDQISQVKSESKKYGTTNEEIDLALLVDGLQSEREQGITIDVAYRFFATDKKKYIIADTPGHEQYTRNMVTGASNADLTVILIDARKGVLTQTRRHSFLVALMGIKHIVIAINKIDLVDYSQEVFEEIKESYLKMFEELKQALPYKHYDATLHFIPISALKGDNVVTNSTNMPWYKEKPLLNYLDSIQLLTDDYQLTTNFRFPVQYVNRPNLDFRGFCGTIVSGSVKVGDEITVLPSGKTTKVKSIINAGDVKENNSLTTNDYNLTTNTAFAPMAITLTTEDEVDISRGDMIVHTNNMPRVSNSLKVMLVWMDETPMEVGKTYDIKSATSLLSGHIEHINYKIDINNYKRVTVDKLQLNDIASCKIVLTRPIAADKYEENKLTGSFIVIDRITNNTVGAGMIVDVAKRESDKKLKENLFDIWNEKKKDIDAKKIVCLFEERDIVSVKIGKNIGYEIDGEGEEFLRIVLVFKKFNKDQFLGFPLTSQKKEGIFYTKISYKDKVNYVILSQLRVFSSKRVSHIFGKASKKNLKEIYESFTNLIAPSS